MLLIVAAHPHGFIGVDANVNADHPSLACTFQLPQPLMGNVEIRQDRHAEDASNPTRLQAGNLLSSNSRPEDLRCIFIGG